MEDRFRFRVWSPGYAPDHRMQYWYPFSEEQIAICIEPDPIIMQCTGLKDCNGTLIYEGDILAGNFGFIEPSRDLALYAVEWLQYAWAVRHVQTGQSELIMPWPKSHQYVVLGNIHEHPHLIGSIYEPSSISKNTPAPPDLAPEPRSKPDTGQGSD